MLFSVRFSAKVGRKQAELGQCSPVRGPSMCYMKLKISNARKACTLYGWYMYSRFLTNQCTDNGGFSPLIEYRHGALRWPVRSTPLAGTKSLLNDLRNPHLSVEQCAVHETSYDRLRYASLVASIHLLYNSAGSCR